MNSVKASLTILFSDPFWIGIYERTDNGKYEVSRVVFGAEPKDYQVYERFLKDWKRMKFSPSMEAESQADKKVNPKRIQREIHKQLNEKYMGTKAQQALKLMQEQNKQVRQQKNRERKEFDKERQFELRQQKKKEKHKGH